MTESSAQQAGDPKIIPRSVAIIMDGNGRWAKKRGFARIRGHEHGITAVRETVEECARLGVRALTLYTFSEENWSRPKLEVQLLMRLLQTFLLKERPILMDNGVRLVHSGRRDRLSPEVQQRLDETIELTAGNDRMSLCLALSYGGRAELADAMKKIAGRVQAGEVALDQIDEAMISASLYRPELPDPDLLIRTAGQMRVSNFLLWQISYAEFYVVDECWPDFRAPHLHAAFRAFGERNRTYGAVSP